MTSSELVNKLKTENIKTWFDLGLFVDRVKEKSHHANTLSIPTYKEFKDSLSQGSIAFISFFFSVDGASMECDKYTRAFQQILGDFKVHYIAGKFYETGNQYLVPESGKYQFDEILAFDDWDLYRDFFYTKLERGSKEYNQLITAFWNQVLVIVKKLSEYIQKHDIRLLYLINTNSNPGNVSLALALVLISEYLNIPVINNNHDFYWEGGSSEIDITEHNALSGPRDHFYRNFHLGEVFSLLEVIYPWDSRKWISLNINKAQCNELINVHGHNPANVLTIDTCVDVEKFKTELSDDRKKEIFKQLHYIFENDRRQIVTKIVEAFPENIERTKLQPVIFSGTRHNVFSFDKDNILLLQPTRILKRKTIEVDFTLVTKLLTDHEVIEYFENNANLKITILVTGPVATGQAEYFYTLIKMFKGSLENINEKFRSRVLLAFMFSEFDKASFQKNFKEPFTLYELYKITTMILLPSETEGRGLPIIEATASGMPIFCRRYYPDHVFAHVIGEDLPKMQRLTVTSFTDPGLDSEIIESVKRQIFAPKAFAAINKRNKEIIQQRYSFENLVNSLKTILYQLYLQFYSGNEDKESARLALDQYEQHISENKSFAEKLINTKNRQYLAGYGQMMFMIMLKSLIDPSYFRVEEKKIRGIAMQFAKELVENTPDPSPLPLEQVHRFYNAVDSLFKYHEGEMDIRFDHSMAYRHRNKINYPYRKYTPQELTGVINILYHKHTSPPPVINISGRVQILNEWHQNLELLYEKAHLEIDHTEDLEQKLMANIPIALFPGKFIELEFKLFILGPLRYRLGLSENERIDDRTIQRKKLAPVYIIHHKWSLGNSVTVDVLKSYVFYSGNSELKTLFKHGICKIIPSKQRSVGIHFYEMGKKPLKALNDLRKAKGILIATGDNATMMTDIVEIDRFHIGKVSNTFTSKILGVPMGSGYIQWVPAGLRFTLAYPTPVQTGKSFSKVLKGFRFKQLAEEMGESKLLKLIRKDAKEKGSPINVVLKSLEKPKNETEAVSYSSINGIYTDGMPWSGIMAKIKTGQADIKWQFSVISVKDKPQTVLQFVEQFNLENKRTARVAWNGGYILNPELVGKLGIPEKFIGSPLGLIISDTKMISPPLFNKSAFLIDNAGKLFVKRVNSCNGILINMGKDKRIFKKENYNAEEPDNAYCYYDLLYPHSKIPGNGRVIVRLAGNKVKDVIKTKKGQTMPVLPVGLALSFPPGENPGWMVGQELEMRVTGLENFTSAIEAGPQLLCDGNICLDMETEGWKTTNSINTQAARLDYIDMRGPKIALGIDDKEDLYILTINGRIRESVGATHLDMAEILKKQGMVQAMGFDPGGSSTLVVDGKTMNISPYNHQYEKDVYSLPPEPRAVANAMIISE